MNEDAPSAAQLPARYAPRACLGKGGSGEVWDALDRVCGKPYALKLLSADAGEAELLALVREATALSGLEGVGLPLVHRFGRAADGRAYLVRDLVEGRSFAEHLNDRTTTVDAALLPLLNAADQLTILHRAGLLHGDIKPANLIVTPEGGGTLVDLGLAAPLFEQGTHARGLTPRFAAPELFVGEPLTVRAEVYSLGATIAEAVDALGPKLELAKKTAIDAVTARATHADKQARHPSVDELAADLRRAAGLPAPQGATTVPLPVVGIDGTSDELFRAVTTLHAGASLVLQGPAGSGRSTLLRRLVWTLGAAGYRVAHVAGDDLRISAGEALDLELADGGPVSELWVAVDLAGGPEASAIDGRLATLQRRGARIIRVVDAGQEHAADGTDNRIFQTPLLARSDLETFVRRAAPALSAAVIDGLLARTGQRPAPLRQALARLAGKPVVRVEDLDVLLQGESTRLPATLESLERAVIHGRFAEAESLLGGLLGRDSGVLESVQDARTSPNYQRLRFAAVRIALAKGEIGLAEQWLDEGADASVAERREAALLRARTALRRGDYAAAATLAAPIADPLAEDPLALDACMVHGLARALAGDLDGGAAILEEATVRADGAKEYRLAAIGETGRAIVAQRRGDAGEARVRYERAIMRATTANDAATLVSARLNLAALLQAEGDLAGAVEKLEAATELGSQAGLAAAVTAATLNLANLDLYLGRYARVRIALDALAARRDTLPPATRAQLYGLEAELAFRAASEAGAQERAARLYALCAEAYEAAGRPMDALEARLEGILARPETVHALTGEVAALRVSTPDLGEHRALAALVEGELALREGAFVAAKESFDSAIEAALIASRKEWLWRALDARARLSIAEGLPQASQKAEEDRRAALGLLEETAARLPRDLREVFWNDPRRKSLRDEGSRASKRNPSEDDATELPVSFPAGRPSPQDVLSLLAGRTALASLHTAPNKMEARLVALLEILRELVREHDLSRLLSRVAEHAVTLVGAERGFVVLKDARGKLETRAARDANGDAPYLSFSRSVAERVVRTGEPVVARNAQSDARLEGARSILALHVQSVACVPIRAQRSAWSEESGPAVAREMEASAAVETRTIGALYLETRTRPGVRFEDELPTLQALADQAAIAIENARLLEENTKRRDELEAMNRELSLAKAKLADSLDRRTEQLQAARRDLRQVRTELRSHFGWAGIVGTSANMRKLYAVLERVKDADIPVLITGESGTGKEVIAKAIHAASSRSRAPFLGLNCGAIPENLLESELFGHVRGAFTGADRDRKGLFREASGGTILLDEIGELPLKMQAGLLRVLQEKTVRPVGGAREESVDVRVVAATNRDLAKMVEEGTFREDLYYRIHVVPVFVPPLRERKDDIPALVDHFLGLFAARHRRDKKTLSREALRALVGYDWPGNVRQLEHVLLNAWILADGSELAPSDLELPKNVPAAASSSRGTDLRRDSSPDSQHVPSSARNPRAKATNPTEFRQEERERILEALTQCSWNRLQAAKRLGMPRRTFYRRLKEYEIL